MARARTVEGITLAMPLTEAAPKILGVRLAELAAQRERALTRDDPEDLHDLRVTTRRLRAALALLGGPLAPAAAAVKRLGDALGRVRDLDVMIEWLDRAREGAEADERHGIAALRGRLAGELPSHEQAMREACALYHRELEPALLGHLRAAGSDGPLGGAPVRRQVARRLERLGRRIDRLPSVADVPGVHAVRIAGKKARYDLELLELAGDPGAADAIASLKQLQETVGEVRDRDVRLERLPGWIARAARLEQPGVVALLRAALAERESLSATLDSELARWRAGDHARELARRIQGR